MQTFRYDAPPGSFASKNEHFCELKSENDEHIDGVIEVSDCFDSSPPIVLSHPHFMEGDEKLFEKFEGLLPDRNLHNSYAFLHPRMSVPLNGISRMQINLKVSKLNDHYAKFDNIILPIVWIETSTESFPLDLKFLFFISSTFVNYIEEIFKFGSIIIFTLSTLYIFGKFLNFQSKK